MKAPASKGGERGRQRPQSSEFARPRAPGGHSRLEAAPGTSPLKFAHLMARSGLVGRSVVRQLQRSAGNTAVVRLIAEGQNAAPGSAAVQRQRPAAGGTAAPAGAAVVPFLFGDLTTYAQVAAAARFAVNQVRLDLKEVDPTVGVHARAGEWAGQVEAWLPYLDSKGEEALSSAAAAVAREYLDDGVRLRDDIAEARKEANEAAVLRELRRARAAALAAAAEAEGMRPKLDDAMRAAFRAGDESLLSRVADVAGNVTDIGMGIHELARETAEEIAHLRSVELAPVGRYVGALNALNKGLAALNLALSLAGDRATTELEEGMRQIGVAAGAFSSLGTLVGLPAHMGLYANLYLVPLTKAIMAGVTRLTEHLHRENMAWTEAFGRPVNFAVEPGGEPMWDFMVAVMHADSAGDIPIMPEPVRKTLLENREKLEAGTREDVPTTGWWRWRELDSPRASEWIFLHRSRVWAMFYGSMSPGRAGRP